MNNEIIEHIGTIKEKKGNTLFISIVPEASCVSCSVKGGCSTATSDEKMIEVFDATNSYEVGEQIDVFYAQKIGFQALFLGYIFPFLLLMLSLVVCYAITNNEGLSGLIALFSLMPYYSILYLLRNQMKSRFSFQIKPRNSTQ